MHVNDFDVKNAEKLSNVTDVLIHRRKRVHSEKVSEFYEL